ncbi:MAG: SAM-dependent methyltransferase [Planctomycetes bacterium B3_Pla]|nr:MAG: SAM-dependent methyltransferase [Planctomycetes bacterium B3_Pla]
MRPQVPTQNYSQRRIRSVAGVKRLFKRVVQRIAGKHYQEEHFIDLIRLAQQDGCERALDVGCGYGEKLKLLQSIGLDVVGIDINHDAVQANSDAGFKCLMPQDFTGSSDVYDLIIMSHIIEHFAPKDLLQFMDSYLVHLKVGGYLLIATPMPSSVFFYDFDHIRPYPPEALDEIFVQSRPQVQFVSKHQLELIDIRMRRRSLLIGRSVYWQMKRPKILGLAKNVAGRLYRYSCGTIGQADGWLGLYRNKGLRNKQG